ncbi:MAG TPA: hypothetical protein EYQ31_06405 [Candidatus Handelsmanbacteria bacterium]|nr:hypothetical protein [Candidatus Handelsmanbacteria bacterium]
MGRRHGVAVSSGTAALQLLLQVLDVQQRRVLMPSYVCTALVHATRAVGAIPTLTDVDPSTGNIDVVPADEGVFDDCAVAILPHMFGRLASAAGELSTRMPVIEDLAMALGAVGAGGSGVAAVCSFYATKVITSGGEGGMVVTDDAALAQAVRELRDYDGRVPDRPRWNFKLIDVGAAVGRVQLRRLPQLLERRRMLAARYDEASRNWAAVRPDSRKGDIDYRYVVAVESGRLDSALTAFGEHGVVARRPVDAPLHELLCEEGSFPGADQMKDRALSLPLYPACPMLTPSGSSPSPTVFWRRPVALSLRVERTSRNPKSVVRRQARRHSVRVIYVQW